MTKSSSSSNASWCKIKLFTEKWPSQIHRRLQLTNQRTPESWLDLLSGIDRIVDNVEQEMLHKWGICWTKQQQSQKISFKSAWWFLDECLCACLKPRGSDFISVSFAHTFCMELNIKVQYCKSSLLSDQTKQARLHKHSCWVVKAWSGVSTAAQPPHQPTQRYSAALWSHSLQPLTISKPHICCARASSLPAFHRCHNQRENSRLA